MHGVGGLQADAARVVHDPLADERKVPRGATGRPVGQLDQACLFVAAGVDPQQAAAAHLHQGLLIEHLDVEPDLLAHLLCDIAHPRRGEMGGRRVAQVAREVRRAGHDQAARGTRARGDSSSPIDHERQAGERRVLGAVGEDAVSIARKDDALDRCLGDVVGPDVIDPAQVQDELGMTVGSLGEPRGGVADRWPAPRRLGDPGRSR